MFFPISSWFPAFALTLAAEAPIVGLAFRGFAKNPFATAIVFLTGNLATHLGIWYVLTQVLTPGSIRFALVAEGWAVGAEALLYWAAVRNVSGRRVLAAAVAANGVSFVLGLVFSSAWPGGSSL